MSVIPRIDLSPSFAQVVNPITINYDGITQETKNIIFRLFRMWSCYHKPQDDWFLQRHQFLSLTSELRHTVLAQKEKSALSVRASQGRRYPWLPGKMPQDSSCVVMDPWSTAWPCCSPSCFTTFLSTLLPDCPSISVRYTWAVKYMRGF